MAQLIISLAGLSSIALLYSLVGLLIPKLPFVRSRRRAAVFAGISFVGVLLFNLAGAPSIGRELQGAAEGRASVVAVSPDLLPGVRDFLGMGGEYDQPNAAHRERLLLYLGKATSAQAVSNWEKGQRQRVAFDSGRSLLFYIKEGHVVAVYDEALRTAVWGAIDR